VFPGEEKPLPAVLGKHIHHESGLFTFYCYTV
jgi:hypothetical protein